MNPPKIAGKIIYFFGYPIFRILIKGTHRAYVVIIHKDTVLVTKNWLGFQKKWRLPGGGVHRGESAAVAAQRELVEELGISVESNDFVRLNDLPINAQYGYTYDLFMINVANKPRMRIDNREIITALFVPRTQLSTDVLSEELAEALRLA